MHIILSFYVLGAAPQRIQQVAPVVDHALACLQVNDWSQSRHELREGRCVREGLHRCIHETRVAEIAQATRALREGKK